MAAILESPSLFDSAALAEERRSRKAVQDWAPKAVATVEWAAVALAAFAFAATGVVVSFG